MRKITSILLILFAIHLNAQDTVHYSGSVVANSDYHHGQLSPIVGVHNIQVLRANREIPETADDFGWTYNHGPNMAYWNGKFYIQYLSNKVSEHIPPGAVFYSNSSDGYQWEKPTMLFPPYKIPDGTTKDGIEGEAKDLFAVLHQRMGFYVAPNGRLLTLGYFGICIGDHDSPNDGNGIGRAVREIYEDGTMGPIHFIRYNHGWNEENTHYPSCKSSKDHGFKKACEALLDDPLMMQQWVEEADRDDPLIPTKKQYKAFSYYHLEDGRIVGLWKHALTSISNDGGLTWEYNPTRAPLFVNKAAKIWGEKLSDGTYATVYNPSQFRWPLAISTSKDGIDYTNLYLINGEISTMRYGGQFKSYGPQYVRGILEGNGQEELEDLWVTYSMNKEDIWVSKVPVPTIVSVNENIDENFNNEATFNQWNIFSPIWAPVKVVEIEESNALELRDKDPYDYAVAERVIPEAEQVTVEFEIEPQQETGLLQIELADSKGAVALRISLNKEGNIINKDAYTLGRIGEYNANKKMTIRIEANSIRNYFEVFVNGERKTGRMCYQKVNSFSRVIFRTGEKRYYPTVESPRMQKFDVDNGGIPVEEESYRIYSFKAKRGIE